MNFDPKSSSFLLRTHCWQRFVYLWRWQKNRCWELSSRKDFLLNCRAHSHLKASSISASVSWCFSSPAAARLFLDSPLPVSTYRLVTVLGRCSRQDFSNGRTLPCSLCWVGKTLSDMHCGLRLSHSRSFLPLLIFAGVSISPPHLTLSQFSSVQLLSRVRLFVTPWMAARQASLSIANSRSLPKLMSIQAVMPSNHLILCRPLLLSPSIFPSIRVFSNESVLHIRWPKYWSFSFSISPHPR